MANSKICRDCARLILDDKTIFGSGVVRDVDGGDLRPALKYRTLRLFEYASTQRTTSSDGYYQPEFFHCIPLPQGRFDTFPLFPNLARSAASGCRFCKMLREAIVYKISHCTPSHPSRNVRDPFKEEELSQWSDFRHDETIQIKFGYFLRHFNYTRSKRAGWKIYDAANDVSGLARFSAKVSKRGQDNFAVRDTYDELPFEFSETHVNFSVEVDSWDSCHVGRYLQIYNLSANDNPLSSRNVALIAGWLSTCTKAHEGICGTKDSYRNSTADTAPTRLVYVGDQAAGVQPRLIIPKETPHQEYFHYVALSYCWGDRPPLKTERHTLSERLQSIPYRSLPPVFRDALTVTTTVFQYVKYVWIDSLCIIQDDPGDWRRESARMANIFRNAVFTIGAAASNSSNDGFLSQRRSNTTQQRIKLPFTSTRHPFVSGTYDIRPETGDELDLMDELNRTRWASRGWVFQEQYLSKRLLVFGPTMLQMHCRAWSSREDCETMFARDLTDTPCFSRHVYETCEVHTHRSRYQAWYDLVELYSGRKLTLFSDRLPAVEGIATEVHAGLRDYGIQDTYLAGLWQNDLLYGLLWWAHPHDSKEQLTNAECYVAPTWCWISYKGRVSFTRFNGSGGRICTIDNAYTSLAAGCGPFGSVLGGVLKVRGLTSRFISFSNPTVLTLCGKLAQPSDGTPVRSPEGIFLDAGTHPNTVEAIEKCGFWILLLWVECSYRTDEWQFSGLIMTNNGGGQQFFRLGMFVSPRVTCHSPHEILDGLGWERRTLEVV